MRDGKELKPCLSGRGVTKVFGFGDAKTVAVDHVDFDFHEGEFVSIVGESGSGKTTLSKMLLGLALSGGRSGSREIHLFPAAGSKRRVVFR